MKKNLLLFILLCCNFVISQVQVFNIDGEKYVYKRPKLFDFAVNIPGTLVSFGEQAFKKEYTLTNIGIAVSTGLLIAYDQPLYEGVAKWGRDLGIGNEDKSKALIKIRELEIGRIPTDFGSTLYFIGDGITHTGIALSFLAGGLIGNDNRALQTASQIAEGILACGFSTQILKRITGREAPVMASQPGGVWRFFPNLDEFAEHVVKFDAYPSGHVSTAMVTVTVIAENYAEYKWIRPVGYTLIGLLSLQMMNNGVHWASDYPLALGMGYLFGKIAVEKGRAKLNSIEEPESSKITITPFMAPAKTYGVSITINF